MRSVAPPVDNERVRFLTGHQVLAAVTEAARSGKYVTAAVAYVGSDAADALPLGEGDLIVVNGSANAIKTGATSVPAIQQWYEAGAEVFSHGHIHAKVFVVGRTTYVGSANLSARARSGEIIEAAVASTDSTLVAEVRAFVHRLADEAEEVDEAWLRWAEEIKVERPPPPWNTEPTFLPRAPFDLWIGETVSLEWSDAEEALVKDGLRVHARRRGRYRTECIAEPLDDSQTLHDGDLVVLIHRGRARLGRFLERRVSRRAAVGFYRVDTGLPAVRRSELGAALEIEVEPGGEWSRVTGRDRRLLLKQWAVTDVGTRTRSRAL